MDYFPSALTSIPTFVLVFQASICINPRLIQVRRILVYVCFYRIRNFKYNFIFIAYNLAASVV